MATDRMDDLDSSREATDRMGQTVILGNAVDSEAVEIIAAAAMTMGSKSDVTSAMNMAAAMSGDLTNGSFGIWAVDFLGAAAGLLVGEGAGIGASPLNAITQGLLTWGADGMLLNIQVFTATGTYTPTAGTAQVVVQCLGAGGGGGGCSTTAGNNSGGGGGGGGALAIGRITSGFSGVTVTVGAGGTGGAAGDNDGSSGGASSFGSVLIGGGGSGGEGDAAGVVARAAAGGAGGSASGTASLFGSRGQTGGYGYASSTAASFSGAGANSLFGSGGSLRITGGGSQAGDNGTGFGSGGSGAASAAADSAKAGGNGAPGLVIIYEYNA